MSNVGLGACVVFVVPTEVVVTPDASVVEVVLPAEVEVVLPPEVVVDDGVVGWVEPPEAFAAVVLVVVATGSPVVVTPTPVDVGEEPTTSSSLQAETTTASATSQTAIRLVLLVTSSRISYLLGGLDHAVAARHATTWLDLGRPTRTCRVGDRSKGHSVLMEARILVVEDDPSIREITKLGLEDAGFEVHTAVDGDEAPHSVRHDHPDLVVVDVMLPKRDGFEVCRIIRAESSIPVLMLTARSDTVDVDWTTWARWTSRTGFRWSSVSRSTSGPLSRYRRTPPRSRLSELRQSPSSRQPQSCSPAIELTPIKPPSRRLPELAG